MEKNSIQKTLFTTERKSHLKFIPVKRVINWVININFKSCQKGDNWWNQNQIGFYINPSLCVMIFKRNKNTYINLWWCFIEEWLSTLRQYGCVFITYSISLWRRSPTNVKRLRTVHTFTHCLEKETRR